MSHCSPSSRSPHRFEDSTCPCPSVGSRVRFQDVEQLGPRVVAVGNHTGHFHGRRGVRTAADGNQDRGEVGRSVAVIGHHHHSTRRPRSQSVHFRPTKREPGPGSIAVTEDDRRRAVIHGRPRDHGDRSRPNADDPLDRRRGSGLGYCLERSFQLVPVSGQEGPRPGRAHSRRRSENPDRTHCSSCANITQ